MSDFAIKLADGAEIRQALRSLASKRILVLDGAMGTEIQNLRLSEQDFRGERFRGFNHDLKGNNDLLILTQPDAVRKIHLDYFRAGADIVETNTFSGTSIAQADYGLEAVGYELNREGARLAREAALIAETEDGRRRFVAGAVGPTNRTLSISPDVNNPGYRAVTFDQVRDSYAEQVRGLVDGGAEIILIETIFDTLNAKAAIVATGQVYVCMEDARGRAIVDKETLEAGQRTRTFRGRRFKVTFGTAAARIRQNDKSYRVAESKDPVGYALRAGRRPQRITSGLAGCT